MLQEAGCPPGVVNVIHGMHESVDFICDHPDIRAISFVGSDTAVSLHSFSSVNIFGKFQHWIWRNQHWFTGAIHLWKRSQERQTGAEQYGRQKSRSHRRWCQQVQHFEPISRSCFRSCWPEVYGAQYSDFCGWSQRMATGAEIPRWTAESERG